MPDLSDTIEQIAGEPAQHTSDGQSTTNADISKVIEADTYLAGKTAATGTNSNGGARSGWGLLRPARAILPGQT